MTGIGVPEPLKFKSQEEARAFIYKVFGRELEEDEAQLLLDRIEAEDIKPYVEAYGLVGWNDEYEIDGRHFSVCGTFSNDEVDISEHPTSRYAEDYEEYKLKKAQHARQNDYDSQLARYVQALEEETGG